MKKIFTLGATLCLFLFCQAQNIGIGTSAPNPNALLDVSSNSKGMLVPRMDSIQRKNLPNTKGLLVYDSRYNSFWYNPGNAWQRIAAGGTNSSAVGDDKSIGDML